MAQIHVQRSTLAKMLRSHGEDELAERVASISDDELTRIGTLAAYYAWSEDALALCGSMGGPRACSLATIDVLEGSGRDLCQYRSDAELGWGLPEGPEASERAADGQLRSHAAEKQLPSQDG